MNLITFGSCMSEGVFAALTRQHQEIKFNYMNHIIHNRSDYFRFRYIDKLWPSFSIESILERVDVKTSPEFPDRDLYDECKFFLANQSAATIGLNRNESRYSFLLNMVSEKIDLILCDNFMDIASLLVEDYESGSKYFIFSGAYSSAQFSRYYKWVDHLTVHESYENWKVIVSWMKLLQPKAKVVFIAFPGSVACQNDKPSLMRAKEFQSVVGEDMALEYNLILSRDVAENDMNSPDDWCHYNKEYYADIASHIKLEY